MSIKTLLIQVKDLLRNHYRVPIRVIFNQFRLGASLFFCGLVGVYADNQLLKPSLAEEVFLLISLVLVGAGFMIAILAQIRMLISRILHFIHS